MIDCEQGEKVMKSKKSLLTKFEIPLDHLSFEYLEKCNDRKELEKIVKILRSGEEGYYPQLTECAESRLKQIAPQSRLLWTEEPVLTKAALGEKNWNKVADEIADWTNEMKSRDQALNEYSSFGLELPAIRQMNNKLPSTQAGKNMTRTKTAAPRDYSEWDKFDVEKEILKMELEDERKKEQIAKNKKQEKEKKSRNEKDNSTLKAASNLSSVEKEYMASQEKDRGNEYYRSGEFEQAVKCYSNSILLCPTPAAYNNRAMAQLKLQKYDAVIEDCNQVLKTESANVKALHRRGLAFQGINCYERAYEDFCKVMEFDPNNLAAKGFADQMKRKLEPSLKSVRLSIEEECCQPKGITFPAPKSVVPVNDWGLAKIMCNCNSTPSWVYRKPSKCKSCVRKRAERRAKREEEARKAAEASKLNVGTDDSENPEIDQMLTDEKGSGDMKAKEKFTELESGEDSNMEYQGAAFTKVEEKIENDIKMNDNAVESMLIKDEKDTMYTCNIVNKENSKNDREGHKENCKNNEINLKGASVEVNNSKTEFACNSRVLENEDKRKCAKDVRQKSFTGNDNPSGKSMKIKIANKYKKNIGAEREKTSELQDCEDIPSVESITSAFEFVKVWESLKITSDLSSHAQVLRSIKPSNMVSVIGNKLDGPMLSTILMCLEKNFTLFSPELVLEYLNNIMQLPRFSIVIMFLKTQEKQAVHTLLENLEKSNVHPSGALWKAFSC